MDMLPALAGFDWLVVLIVGTAATFGLIRGFIGEVASLAGWIAGFVAVRLFYTPLRAIFATATGSEVLAAIAAVIGPFLLAVLLVKLLGSVASNTARNSIIGPVDRLLGLGFGVVKGFLAASLLFLVITLALKIVPGGSDRPEWLAKARTTPTLALVASAMVSWVGDAWKQQQADDPHAGPGGGSGDRGEAGGYDRRQRRSLDTLLDQQEKTSPGTAI
ncbi:MAG: CvpA family protein [Sphingomonadales bacterium]|jgi:membrane protein required for colicin V production